MARDGEPTRQRILDAALPLFAERGLAVSLREIRIAANQKNAAALQYHFSDKLGVLRALLERELPPIVARRRELLAEAAKATGYDAERAVAAIFVLPFAELATGTEHERFVLLLLSHLHDDVSLSFADIMALVGDTAVADATALLRTRASDIPDQILSERLIVANSIFLHAAVMRARGGNREKRLTDAQFRENLVDMFRGALFCASFPAPDKPLVTN